MSPDSDCELSEASASAGGLALGGASAAVTRGTRSSSRQRSQVAVHKQPRGLVRLLVLGLKQFVHPTPPWTIPRVYPLTMPLGNPSAKLPGPAGRRPH